MLNKIMTNALQPTINFNEYLSTLDWIIFSLVMMITLISVIYGQYLKNNNNKDTGESLLDLLLMGRKLTLPLFVATLVATWYGGIFGVTRIAFEKGIFNFITQGVFWYITYLLFAFFLIKKISKYEALTLPDLIGQMFGPKSLKLSAIFNFFNVLPIVYVISLGLFIQIFIGGSLTICMIIGVVFVLLYATFGGFRAVVFSDLVQFFVMCLGVAIILIYSVYHFGGISFLKANLPETHFSLTGEEGIWATLVWGFIALSTLVDPNFYQRCFAAKNTSVAKKGIIISTFIWFLFDICTTFGAMYARATIPEAAPENAYFIYALQIIPNGLRGFFLAGILATILSTLDSYLFLAGTTLTYDLLWGKLKKKIWLHHFGIVLVAIIAIVMATLFNGNIKIVWKTLGSYSASCLLLPVMAGHLFPGKISDNRFVISCLLGVIGTTWWRLAPHTGFLVNIDELYIGVLCTLTGLIFPKIGKKR
jgi:SSS family solute:Na+ symporter